MSRITILFMKPVFALVALCATVQGAEYEFNWVNGGSVVPVPDGAVWLYHYSWGALQRHKLADIHKGEAQIELTARTLADDVKAPSNTRAFVLVLEFPGNRWYRTVDIEATNLLQDFVLVLESLGTLEKSNRSSVKKLVLPAQVERRFRFLSPEAVPLARKRIPVAIYVSTYNHCAVHEGLPLGTFETDTAGWLVVPAPELPLYMDLLYWVPDGQGFAGQMYAFQDGMIIQPTNEVTQLRWSLPSEQWELRLRSQQGQPVSKVRLMEWVRINGCGANWRSLGVTDDEGFVRVTLLPQTVARLAFQNDSGAQRDLSVEELATLWREKKLTVTWPGERH